MAAIMFSVIRRSSTKLDRAISSPKFLEHGLNVLRGRYVITTNRYFSTVADGQKKVTDLEILNFFKPKIESLKKHIASHMSQAPSGFPFEIKDIRNDHDFFCQYGIQLTRHFAGEQIVVTIEPMDVIRYRLVHENKADDEDDASSSTDGHKERAKKRSRSLVLDVYISKENNPDKLHFHLKVKSDFIDYRNTEIHINQERIDKRSHMGAWMKFLKIRGIDETLFRFLFDYFPQRDKRHRLIVMETVQDFLDK